MIPRREFMKLRPSLIRTFIRLFKTVPREWVTRYWFKEVR